MIYGTERVAFRLLQESYNFRNGTELCSGFYKNMIISGVVRILCQGAQVWLRKKTENNKCIPYHPGQHSILPSMRYCIMPVCRAFFSVQFYTKVQF